MKKSRYTPEQVVYAYRIQSIQHFVGVDLGSETAPEATMVLKFRRLLEERNLTRAIFEEVDASLAAHGLYMKQGTIVDATIIAAPSSTKDRSGERDPEMHQTKMGNQWHFGMRADIGVDVGSGLVHSHWKRMAVREDKSHSKLFRDFAAQTKETTVIAVWEACFRLRS